MFETIIIRVLDKRYTYARYQCGCAMDGCQKKPTHWLTRSNQYYCQSDLICSRHARIWYQVKKLLGNN